MIVQEVPLTKWKIYLIRDIDAKMVFKCAYDDKNFYIRTTHQSFICSKFYDNLYECARQIVNSSIKNQLHSDSRNINYLQKEYIQFTVYYPSTIVRGIYETSQNMETFYSFLLNNMIYSSFPYDHSNPTSVSYLKP